MIKQLFLLFFHTLTYAFFDCCTNPPNDKQPARKNSTRRLSDLSELKSISENADSAVILSQQRKSSTSHTTQLESVSSIPLKSESFTSDSKSPTPITSLCGSKKILKKKSEFIIQKNGKDEFVGNPVKFITNLSELKLRIYFTHENEIKHIIISMNSYKTQYPRLFQPTEKFFIQIIRAADYINQFTLILHEKMQEETSLCCLVEPTNDEDIAIAMSILELIFMELFEKPLEVCNMCKQYKIDPFLAPIKQAWVKK